MGSSANAALFPSPLWGGVKGEGQQVCGGYLIKITFCSGASANAIAGLLGFLSLGKYSKCVQELRSGEEVCAERRLHLCHIQQVVFDSAGKRCACVVKLWQLR